MPLEWSFQEPLSSQHCQNQGQLPVLILVEPSANKSCIVRKVCVTEAGWGPWVANALRSPCVILHAVFLSVVLELTPKQSPLAWVSSACGPQLPLLQPTVFMQCNWEIRCLKHWDLVLLWEHNLTNTRPLI
jgi:hypothetical protein